FHSPYAGTNSLTGDGASALTETYGLYLGSRLGAHLDAYLDVEMARGGAVGNAVGLGSLTNGDVVRIGSVDLGQDPYVARAYLRYVVPLGGETVNPGRGIGQLPGQLAADRLEFKLGKFALTDDFDANRYANSTRTQFMTWSLWNNTAWDYAADTRGYTNGAYLGWITPSWELRFAAVQVVTFENGNLFDRDLQRAHAENMEATVRTGTWGPVLRALAWQNQARMGDYREALATAQANGGSPDIVADERPGRVKYGYGLNVEQPLAAEGETGLFLRAGWNDGATEDFMFTESDQLLSLGLQLCGCHWSREADRAGIGVAVNGLSNAHRDYLAAGGLGFILGDGKLSYGDEMVTEFYYRLQAGTYVQISPDVQYIVNPGYNQDRGPALVLGLRLRVYDF
ncbi:MAG TPA: carbohydrate porin, partial [bacterium]|nr:carbohydrate porin [bacterium]